MPYWDCPRCAAENSLNANSCWRCGFQNYGGAQDAAPPAEHRESPTGLLDKQRRSIREDVKNGLEDDLERTRATLDRLARRRKSSSG